MKVVLLDDTVREYPVSAEFCGVGFKSVTLTAKDFEKLTDCPDLQAWFEKVFSRMAPDE